MLDESVRDPVSIPPAAADALLVILEGNSCEEGGARSHAVEDSLTELDDLKQGMADAVEVEETGVRGIGPCSAAGDRSAMDNMPPLLRSMGLSEEKLTIPLSKLLDFLKTAFQDNRNAH